MQKSINPFDQSLLAEFPLMNERDVVAKLAKADLTFQSWRSTSMEERSRLMIAAASVIENKKEEYARLISLEMGKAIREARNEIQKCADCCKYYATHAQSFLAPTEIQTEAARSYVTFQPTGVVLAVMPWNFPFWQVFRFAVPVLMAGNVGVLKHSSNVPQCALAIEKIFQEAGFPDGAFQSFLVSNELVEKIIESDCVHGVALTGSEHAGSSVAALAGKHIKKTVLELGGSDPFIVLPDANLPETIKTAVKSRMQNAGQSCIAAKRFIVHQDIKDDFVEAFKAELEKVKQGNPLDESVTMGPVARKDLAEELVDQLNRSIKGGAKLVTGGQRQDANVKPILLDHVRPGIAAFDEETFGPLAAVIEARDEMEAMQLANRTRYGLGASIWTADTGKAEALAAQIDSGTVYINSLMRSDFRLPFGGVKKSGYGRELSIEGIREFVNIKSIVVYKI